MIARSAGAGASGAALIRSITTTPKPATGPAFLSVLASVQPYRWTAQVGLVRPCSNSRSANSLFSHHRIDVGSVRTRPTTTVQSRLVHTARRLTARPIPAPTPFVPDVDTFLKLIGRKMSAFSGRIPSWDALFRMSTVQLEKAGIEPTRQRRYLLRWREKFRQGDFGVGGDLTYVSPEGVAELRVYEQPFPPAWIEAAAQKRKRQIEDLRHQLAILTAESSSESAADSQPTPGSDSRPGPLDEQTKIRKIQGRIAVLEANPATHSTSPNSRLIVVNVPSGTGLSETCPVPIAGLNTPRFLTVKNSKNVAGPFVMPLKGSDGAGGSITIQEGLWEDKRGRKIDGGERRRAEVQAKRRIAENRQG